MLPRCGAAGGRLGGARGQQQHQRPFPAAARALRIGRSGLPRLARRGGGAVGTS